MGAHPSFNPQRSESVKLDAHILNALAPLPLPNLRSAKLWQRLTLHALYQKPGSVRIDQAPWQRFLPGIDVKVLNAQDSTETAIWRMQPGAKIPPHPHAQDEECLILQGSLLVEHVRYHVGDFLMARAGESDPIFYAPDGALLLIRAGLRPQIGGLLPIDCVRSFA